MSSVGTGKKQIQAQLKKMKFRTTRESCDYILSAGSRYGGLWCEETKTAAFEGRDFGEFRTWKAAKKVLMEASAEEYLVDKYRESLR